MSGRQRADPAISGIRRMHIAGWPPCNLLGKQSLHFNTIVRNVRLIRGVVIDLVFGML